MSHVADRIEALCARSGELVRLHPAAGTVLIYQEHQAGGVYVIAKGCIHLRRYDRGELRLDRCCTAAVHPWVVPSPGALDAPCPWSVVAGSGLVAWFVPRSVALSDPAVAALLAGIAAIDG